MPWFSPKTITLKGLSSNHYGCHSIILVQANTNQLLEVVSTLPDMNQHEVVSDEVVETGKNLRADLPKVVPRHEVTIEPRQVKCEKISFGRI